MGLIFSIGVIWVTYQVFNNINVETVKRRERTKIALNGGSDINAA